MLNWRNGKGGFVGGFKNIIRGVFKYNHSITSETIATPDGGDSVLALISDTGISVLAAINDDGLGVESLISDSGGVNAIINSTGVSVTALIDDDGDGVETEI